MANRLRVILEEVGSALGWPLNWMDADSPPDLAAHVRNLVGNGKRAWDEVAKLQQVVKSQSSSVPPKVREEALELARKGCNRHEDCAAADEAYQKKHKTTTVPVNFHCHDEGCEDCFGC